MGTVLSGTDTYVAINDKDYADAAVNFGSTLMNFGLVSTAIPGLQAAAPFIGGAGAAFFIGGMLVKKSKAIVSGAKTIKKLASKAGKGVKNGFNTIAKGFGSLFG